MRDRTVELRWGTETVRVELPERARSLLLVPRRTEPPRDIAGEILSLLRSADGTSLEELCRGVKRVLIVVSDRTRVTGVGVYLPLLVRFLLECGVDDEGIEILVATGMHAPSGKKHLAEFLPSEVLGRFRVSEHDCRDTTAHFHAGRTTRGTEVYLNRKAVQAGLVILTGSIGFHYFAGYRGGRKSILPGIAAFETISANHRLTIPDERGFHPLCRNGSLEGNPVHEDMVEALSMIPPSFLLNTLTDVNGGIVSVFAGDPVKAHLKGCETFRESAEVGVAEKAECVIVSCGGYPRDSTLIQSHKAIENVSSVLSERGSMVVLARCEEGIGSDTFLSWFEGRNLSEVRKKLVSNYTLHGHTALSAMEKANRFRVYLVSRLSEEVVRSMGFVYASSAEKALEDILDRRKGELATLVFPEGSETLPVLEAERLGRATDIKGTVS